MSGDRTSAYADQYHHSDQGQPFGKSICAERRQNGELRAWISRGGKLSDFIKHHSPVIERKEAE